MTVAELINECGPSLGMRELLGDPGVEVTSLTLDSRRAGPGALFIAQVGEKADGHTYIYKALQAGCRAVLCECVPESVRQTQAPCTFVVAQDTHRAAGLVADAFHGHPSRQLTLVGVTGTNGKTTIATLLYRLALSLGHKAGLFSTVANYIGERRTPAMQTTPDTLTLHADMARMVAEGCQYCFMEVSSHSIVQQRIAGLDFDGGIFTNLTHDHLDYHKTFANYVAAKKLFFDGLKAGAYALTNVDDPNGRRMTQNTAARQRTYSLRTVADYTATIVEESMQGMTLRLGGREAAMRLVGRFNAYNLAAIYGAATELRLAPDQQRLLAAMSDLHAVDGRFEPVVTSQGVVCIVDYAHTPDALRNVLSTIADVKQGAARPAGDATPDQGRRQAAPTVFCVVGCGGDRDRTKRPEMAQEAFNACDRLILTSDNPRTERPDDILADMLAGLDQTQRQATLTIPDRREAIATAVRLAKPNDIVLVAGKGHEDYQEIDGVKHHFSDREEILKL